MNIEEFYQRDYYRIIDMTIELIHTYFNETDINIYKQMEQILKIYRTKYCYNKILPRVM